MSYNTVNFPGGASPSFGAQHLPPTSGRYSPQPGYQPPLAGGYGAAGGYGQPAQPAQPGYPQQVQPGYSQQVQPGYPQQVQPGYPTAVSPQPGAAPMMPGQVASPAPGGQQAIAPGSITYTTSTGPDGRVLYHPFKAVPASYQTPQGVVSGIQWIPAEATSVIPAGAQPADAGFAASWNRGHLSEDDKRSIEKWQRDEEKRRRRDEKEAAKRVHEWEHQRREREKAEEREDRELRKARERDAGTTGYRDRQRRGSFNAGAPGAAGSYGVPTSVPPGVAGSVPGGYPSSGYERERKYSTGGSPDITRRMEELALGGGGAGGPYTTRERKNSTGFAMPRSRRGSMNAGVLEAAIRAGTAGSDSSDRGGAYGSRSYGAGAGYGQPTAYGGAAPGRPLSRAASPYRSPMPNRSPLPGEMGLPNAPIYGVPTTYSDGGHARRASGVDPYGRPVSPSPYGGAGVPGGEGIFPRGHVLEGQPISRSPMPGGGPGGAYGAPGYASSGASAVGGMPPIVGYASGPSRPPSRLGGANMPGPYHSDPAAQGQMMAPPEGFTRPPNRSQPYTAFDSVRIQALDEIADHMPRMPMVLVPHDVFHQDWIRFMTDVSLAWQDPGRVGKSRSSSAVADLVELWNAQFFLPRSAEIVLYKGAERRTGPDAGSIDREVLEDAELEVSSSSEEEDPSDLSDRGGYGAGAYGGGMYGNQGMPQMRDQRRMRRAEAKAERRRRRKEKKMRRRAREAERTYSLYVVYAPVGAGPEVGPRAPLYVGM